MSGRRRPKINTAAPLLARVVEGVQEYARNVLERHTRSAKGDCTVCSNSWRDAWVEFPCDAVKLALRVMEVK